MQKKVDVRKRSYTHNSILSHPSTRASTPCDGTTIPGEPPFFGLIILRERPLKGLLATGRRKGDRVGIPRVVPAEQHGGVVTSAKS